MRRHVCKDICVHTRTHIHEVHMPSCSHQKHSHKLWHSEDAQLICRLTEFNGESASYKLRRQRERDREREHRNESAEDDTGEGGGEKKIYNFTRMFEKGMCARGMQKCGWPSGVRVQRGLPGDFFFFVRKMNSLVHCANFIQHLKNREEQVRQSCHGRRGGGSGEEQTTVSSLCK